MTTPWERQLSAMFAKFLSEARTELKSPTFSRGPSKGKVVKKVVYGRCPPCGMSYNDPRFPTGTPCIHCQKPLLPPLPVGGSSGGGGGGKGPKVGKGKGDNKGGPSVWSEDQRIARSHKKVAAWHAYCAKVREDVENPQLVIPAPPEIASALAILDNLAKAQTSQTKAKQPTPDDVQAYESELQVMAVLEASQLPACVLDAKRAELDKLRKAATPCADTATKNYEYFTKQLSEAEANFVKQVTQFDKEEEALKERQQRLDVARQAHLDRRDAASASYLALKQALQEAQAKQAPPTPKLAPATPAAQTTFERLRLQQLEDDKQRAVEAAQQEQATKMVARAEEVMRDLDLKDRAPAAELFARFFKLEVDPKCPHLQTDDSMEATNSAAKRANEQPNQNGVNKNARRKEPDANSGGKGVGSAPSTTQQHQQAAAATAAAQGVSITLNTDSDDDMEHTDLWSDNWADEPVTTNPSRHGDA